jgi:mRNA interferase MazF
MYKQGTVVLTPFPFTDLSGDKVRPAVVVSNNAPGEDVIVVFVTSKAKTKGVSVVSVSPSTNNGIKVISAIVCSKIATLNKKVLLGELGTLSEKDRKEVLKSIKVVLGL